MVERESRDRLPAQGVCWLCGSGARCVLSIWGFMQRPVGSINVPHDNFLLSQEFFIRDNILNLEKLMYPGQ